MEAKTIEDLSEYALLEIFGKLDCLSLKYAALVCKSWNNLIGSSAVTKNTFRFKVYSWMIVGHTKSSRKHRSLGFGMRDNQENSNKVYNFLLNCDLSLVEDIEVYAVADSSMDGMELLARMPNLREGSAIDLLQKSPSDFRVNLPKLKKLWLSRNLGFLDYLTAPKITEIFIPGGKFSGNVDALRNFLIKSESLKSLSVNVAFFRNFFDPDRNAGFKFQLTSLELYGTCTAKDTSMENFRQFLQSQASTLKTLTLDPHFNQCDVTMRAILVGLNLESLHINGSSLPPSDEFYTELSYSTSLKDLKVTSNKNGNEAAVKLLCKLPNLESLHLDFAIENEAAAIVWCSSKLERLTVQSLVNLKFDSARYANLKYLNVKQLTGSIQLLLDFIAECPTLEVLKVHRCPYLAWRERDIRQLMDLSPALKSISFNSHKYEITADKEELTNGTFNVRLSIVQMKDFF